MLRKEAPECMEENKNKHLLFCATIIFTMTAMYPIKKLSRELFLYIIPTKKFPVGTKMRLTKAEMMAERVYKFLVYCITTTWLFAILKNSNFLHNKLAGDQADP